MTSRQSSSKGSAGNTNILTFRGFLLKKRYKELILNREKAALVIQRSWKGSRWKRLVPKLIEDQRIKLVTIIQKWIRGYLSRKHAYKQLSIVYIASK